MAEICCLCDVKLTILSLLFVFARRALAERGTETAVAMQAIKARLSPIPGRKNLIWIAGSFPAGSSGFDDIAVYAISTLGLETGMLPIEERPGQPDPNLGAAPVYRAPVEPFREFAEGLAADAGGRKNGFELVQDMPGGAGEFVVAVQDTPSGQIGTLRFTR